MNLPTEEQEQRTLIHWLTLHGYAYFHVPNSTYTTSWKQKSKNKALGVVKGVPDLFVFAHGKRIAIELKRQKGGRASKEQLDWLTRLANYGFEAAVCHGYAEAIEFIESVVPKEQTIKRNKEVF